MKRIRKPTKASQLRNNCRRDFWSRTLRQITFNNNNKFPFFFYQHKDNWGLVRCNSNNNNNNNNNFPFFLYQHKDNWGLVHCNSNLPAASDTVQYPEQIQHCLLVTRASLPLVYLVTVQQAVCLQAGSKALAFEMEATSRLKLLSTVYRRNWYSETRSDFAQQNTCQNVLTDEKWRTHSAQTHTDNYSMGSFPGVKRSEREAGQKLYLLRC